MKKLLSLLLCLTLFLSVMGMTDTALAAYRQNFGDFTMVLPESAIYYVLPEKIQLIPYAWIAIDYDGSKNYDHNIIVTWLALDLSLTYSLLGPEGLAESMGEMDWDEYGFFFEDGQLIDSKYEHGVATLTFYRLVDHDGHLTPEYALLAFHFKGQGGTYVFACNASSSQNLKATSIYLDSIKFK